MVPLEAEFYVDYRFKSLPREPLRVFREIDLIKGGLRCEKVVKRRQILTVVIDTTLCVVQIGGAPPP